MFASFLFAASNVVKLGQVTPGGGCLPHKSGPALAVSLINALNNGQGFPVGTNNKYITFNLTQYDAGSTGGTPVSSRGAVDYQLGRRRSWRGGGGEEETGRA